MLELKLTDPCPCQKEKFFGKCCYHPIKKFKTPYCITRTPGAKTGHQNPNCYVADLRDCSTKISREHFISKGILDVLNENKGMTVNNFPWLKPNEEKRITPNNLVGNILCERHNNALSCLDAVALKFFKTVSRILQEFNDEKTADVERVFLFNGHDIERWLLKTLCGSVFSGNTMDQNREIIKWKPSVTWVNMIYGTQHFAPRYGMYLYAETGGEAHAEREVSLSPISDKEGEIRGASITIMGIITFKLLMITPPPNISFNHTYYRPPEIIFKIGDVAKVIAFAWDIPVEQRALAITLRK